MSKVLIRKRWRSVARLPSQEIPNLGQQLDLRRRLGGSGRRLLPLEPVDPLDGDEKHPGDDQKIDGCGQKLAPAEHRTLLLGVSVGNAGVHFRRQRGVIVREIEPTGDRADDRHDDVADERSDDGSERRADDDADGEIDHVAAHRELLEFFPHGQPPFGFYRCRPTSPQRAAPARPPPRTITTTRIRAPRPTVTDAPIYTLMRPGARIAAAAL